MTEEKLKSIHAHYGGDMAIDLEEIKLEVNRWRYRWSIREPTDPLPQKLVETLDVANAAFYPAIYVAVKTLLTYPVSACATERSFSSMKRLKTPPRNTMTDHRLSLLAILHIRKRNQCWECARPVCTAQRKTPRSLLINDNCTIKRKTLLSACSRIHNQNNVVFAPSLLKIRARRFVHCLYSHNHFERKIKNAQYFSFSLLRFLDHMYLCVLEKMTTLRAWLILLWGSNRFNGTHFLEKHWPSFAQGIFSLSSFLSPLALHPSPLAPPQPLYPTTCCIFFFEKNHAPHLSPLAPRPSPTLVPYNVLYFFLWKEPF